MFYSDTSSKSVAALGSIVGPLVAVYFYGWMPALIWLIVCNFFIGWVQDYSAMMSVRNDGGWHSLVSSGLTSKQLEFETDARPVGGGTIITEGIVDLSSVASVMILSTYLPAAPAYVRGASALTSSLTGISRDAMNLFYAMFVAVMGMITSMLFVRVWRTVSAELFERNILGNRWVSPLVLVLIMLFLAFTGSWVNLWLLFEGTNQLLAGLALLLVAVYLARVRRPTWYVIYPEIFMAITTVAALVWEGYTYAAYLLANKPVGVQTAVQA
jgi:carbon starvation protein